jgi:hypothetical protein
LTTRSCWRQLRQANGRGARRHISPNFRTHGF